MSANPVEIGIEEALLLLRSEAKGCVPLRIRLGADLYTTWAIWWMEWVDRELGKRGALHGEIPTIPHTYGGLPIVVDEAIPPREFMVDTQYQGAKS